MTSLVPAWMRVLRVSASSRAIGYSRKHVSLFAEELKTSVDTDGAQLGAEGLPFAVWVPKSRPEASSATTRSSRVCPVRLGSQVGEFERHPPEGRDRPAQRPALHGVTDRGVRRGPRPGRR
ncbi:MULTISPECIES: hypothetical protein [Streptomyces]|uniref:hypothetical protein n=1 Tax=Streptomyces TaxID=1883 RepID=UPI001152AF8A|nr:MULTISPECIES: hypothetical protein [Streptomyces]